MPVLEWDAVGERMYHAGVDRGVLYLNGLVVPWNGLTGIDEAFNRESKEFYQDGVKYLDHQVLGEFSGKLKAYTYPDAFEEVLGNWSKGHGLFIHDQRPKSFGLSFRTKIGNDLDGLDHGYRIHLLYNLRVNPDGRSYSSVGAQVDPQELAWAISSTPEIVPGYRPTAHVSFKSTDLKDDVLAILEEILYGSVSSEPYLPSVTELMDLINNPILIVDNGDGTWTASGSDRAVALLSPTSFQLVGSGAIYLDEDTYEIPVTQP